MIPGRLDARLWTPARYIAMTQVCAFCERDIPRSKPGARVGERGTKAYFNSALGLWECIPCREEATRAELAGQEPQAPRVEACEACEYRRLDSDSPSDAPLFDLRPCDGCELAAGRGLHRTCPNCLHVEHRTHVSQTSNTSPRAPEVAA